MEKKEEIKLLKEEFLYLYARKEEIVSNLITTTYVEYTDLIGRAEFEVFNLQIQLKAIKMKIKLAQAYINRNERPDTGVIENEIELLWKKHEKELERMMEYINISNNSRIIPEDDVKDARIIYKMLVKKLHPDLHPEISEELRDMLTVAQAAYKNYDINTLRQLAIKYHFISASIHEENDSIYDENFIDNLQTQIAKLKEEIEKHENSFPLNFRERLHDKMWVQERQLDLLQQIEELKTEIVKKEEIYSLIID